MLTRVLGTLYHSLLLLRLGGLDMFFRQLKRQIYSRETLIRVERNLDGDLFDVPSRLEYSLRLGSEKDMEEVFRLAKLESKEAAHKWVYRKWCYECGYRNCYIARTADTGDICHVHWVISPEEDNLLRQRLPTLWPKLNDGECVLENAYTFERYRGMRIMPSVQAALCKIARTRGFKRVVGYIDQDNRASLKGAEMAGYRRVQEVRVLRAVFFTKRKNQPLNKHRVNFCKP